MQEANNNVLKSTEEVVAYYCKAIIEAETPEEVTDIQNYMVYTLKECGLDNGDIEEFTTIVDAQLIALRSGNLVFDEKGLLVSPEQNNVHIVDKEVEGPSPNGMTNVKMSSGLGLAAAALVATIALKSRILKNQKNKTK